MNTKKNELIRERDILGLEKPTDQLKRVRSKGNTGFFILTLIILAAAIVVLYFLDK